MANVPASVAARWAAQGTQTLVSLLELQTFGGNRYFFSDYAISTLALLTQFDSTGTGGGRGGTVRSYRIAPPVDVTSSGPTVQSFLPWLVTPPAFRFTGTLATSTADCELQNLSGTTYQRAASEIFAGDSLAGAMFLYRLFDAAAEYASITVLGSVDDSDVDDSHLSLQLSGSNNWSKIKAPDGVIDPNCQNTFGSLQCGSTSSTPCQNTYGTCTSIQRFKGVVLEWSTDATTVPAIGSAQPLPPSFANLRRPS